MLLLEKQELICRQGHFPLASACAHPAEPWAGKGKGRERSWLFHRAQQGREKLLPSFTRCEAAPQSQPKKTPEEEGWEVLRANRPWP